MHLGRRAPPPHAAPSQAVGKSSDESREWPSPTVRVHRGAARSLRPFSQQKKQTAQCGDRYLGNVETLKRQGTCSNSSSERGPRHGGRGTAGRGGARGGAGRRGEAARGEPNPLLICKDAQGKQVARPTRPSSLLFAWRAALVTFRIAVRLPSRPAVQPQPRYNAATHHPPSSSFKSVINPASASTTRCDVGRW